jgi:hypothetical protein
MSKFTSIPQDTLIVKQDPSKVYGGISYIVQQKSGSNTGIGISRQNLAIFDFEFILPFLLFLLLTIFTVGFRKSIIKIFDSFLRFKKFISYQRNQILGQDLFFIYLILLSIFACALFVAQILKILAPNFLYGYFASVFGVVSGVIALFFACKFLIIWIIGIVTERKQLFFDIIASQLFSFAIMGFFIIVAFVVKDFLDEIYLNTLLIVLSSILFLIFCQYFFRSFRLFVYENVPIFFWFLYFCTIEIMPIALFIKYLEGV